jgi:predicted ribosomally synthesized peptide with SipW-like signal peptide
MARTPRLLLAAVVIGLVSVLTGSLTYATFSSSTASSGNSFAAGTVDVADNDAGVAMLSLSSAQPGATDTGCIRVTYSGSLDANLRLHATVSGSLAPYLTLTVTRGTDASPSFDSCASFTPDATDYVGAGAGVVYSGLLSAYPTSYAAGVVDPPSGPVETWTSGEARSYRLSISLNNDNAAQGLSATAAFSWEARNL